MSGVEEAGTGWKGAETTVSERIRELDRAGHSRADIARMLGKRYQHIRNVLEADKLKAAPVKPETMPTQVPAGPTSPLPNRFRFVVGSDGTLTLSPEAQAALGVKPGGVVIGLMRGESMMLTEGGLSSRRARDRCAPYIKPGVSVVDEFIDDRRKEAERELYG